MSNQVAVQATPVAPVVNEDKVLDNVSARVRQFQNNGEIHFPANYSPENALKASWLIIQETKDMAKRPALQVCTKASVANAMLSMVIQGLNPVKKQGYFIVYGNQLQFQRSYFGTMAVCKQVTGAKDIFAEVVYEGDEFEYTIRRGKKTVTKHVQKLGNIDRKKILAAYCTIVTVDDQEISDIMTFDEIQQSWKKSKTGAMKDGELNPTSTHAEYTAEMSKKTVTNRACKNHINSSDDSNLVINHFNAQETTLVDAQVDAEISANANMIPLDMDDYSSSDNYPDNVDCDTGEIIEERPEEISPYVSDVDKTVQKLKKMQVEQTNPEPAPKVSSSSSAVGLQF
jgi:recombination protein RecT